MTEQQIQYQYMERLRRQTLYRNYAVKLQSIQAIRQFIWSGGDIKSSPMYEDYLRLVDEYGERLFVFDENVGDGAGMTKEDGNV